MPQDMQQVVIIGCGVVGAMIAYELSQCPDLAVTVCDRQAPAQGATGAALGVLMAAISHKVKGNAMRMRLESVRRYDTLIPELEEAIGQSIPYNRQGLLHLCFEQEDWARWQALATIRQSQGWTLNLLNRDQVPATYPYLEHPELVGAVHSMGDRQVDPTALTLALVNAAQQRGVQFQFGVTVQDLEPGYRVLSDRDTFAADWVVIAAGIGSSSLASSSLASSSLASSSLASSSLTKALKHPVDIRPVLGQALRLRLPASLSDRALQPVITGNDTHIVPLGNHEYWIGATVEFPDIDSPEALPHADSKLLDQVLQQAIAFCPALATADILHTWSGLRPRPYGRAAPVIEPLPGHQQVILATGHYRNGILLAPATATAIRTMIQV